MQRVAAVLAAMATATLVAGCGGHGDREQVRFDAGAGQFNVPSRSDGLPPGHPVCPAGRQQLERGADDGAGGFDGGPQLIST